MKCHAALVGDGTGWNSEAGAVFNGEEVSPGGKPSYLEVGRGQPLGHVRSAGRGQEWAAPPPQAVQRPSPWSNAGTIPSALGVDIRRHAQH